MGFWSKFEGRGSSWVEAEDGGGHSELRMEKGTAGTSEHLTGSSPGSFSQLPFSTARRRGQEFPQALSA